MVTFKPLDCSNLAREAAKIPFPKEEVTPPVTKIIFAITVSLLWDVKVAKFYSFQRMDLKNGIKFVLAPAIFFQYRLARRLKNFEMA